MWKNSSVNDAAGRTPYVITTDKGTLLLADGWWGLARHINYFGDLLMGLAWCAAAGFDLSAHAARQTSLWAVVPWFYEIYFVILLVHRERRDNQHCAAKYGAAWEEYTVRVPWRMVPFIY